MNIQQPSPDFLNDLASPQPDPGGGSAAAYSALVALALAEKVARLEQERDKPRGSTTSVWPGLSEEIHRLRENLSHLCHQDTLVYANLAHALRQRAEGKSRRAAIFEAIDCPRQIMGSVSLALATAMTIGTLCRRHLVADVLVVAEILGGALQGACHIAMANVPWLEGPSERSAIIKQLEGERRIGIERLDRTRTDLAGRLLDGGSSAGKL